MTRADEPDNARNFLQGRGLLAGALAFILFSFYIFSIALVPIRSDNDCWWHVKSGWYIAHYGIPSHDVFSYTAENYEWHNHEWLSQLAFYAAYEAGELSALGGWRGVILFKAVVLWIGYGLVFFFAARLSRSFWLALLVAALAVAIGRRTFYPRPPVISNVLLMVEIILLTGVCEGWLRRAWVFVLVPMIAVWANLHGAWIAGGVVLACFAIDQAAALLRHRLPRLPFAVPRVVLGWRWLAILLPLSLLATFLNPYGWRLYELPARVMSDPDLVRSIGELQAPDFYFVIDFELAIHAAFLMALMLTRFRPRIFEVLIYLFFLHQGIQHVRHLFLFSIMMVPLYSRLLGAAAQAAHESLAEWKPLRGRATPAIVPHAIAGLVALYAMSWVIVNPREGGSLATLFSRDAAPSTYIQRNLDYLGGQGYVRSRYPAFTCDLIELAELEGRMFNENRYGGYLIWRLSPEEHKVFSDPRFDIFGGEIWRVEAAIAAGYDNPAESGPPTWQRLLDEYDIQWIINQSTTGLATRLIDSADWIQVSESPNGFQVWIRNSDGNQEMIERARQIAVALRISVN